jgi:hypothetical protein
MAAIPFPHPERRSAPAPAPAAAAGEARSSVDAIAAAAASSPSPFHAHSNSDLLADVGQRLGPSVRMLATDPRDDGLSFRLVRPFRKQRGPSSFPIAPLLERFRCPGVGCQRTFLLPVGTVDHLPDACKRAWKNAKQEWERNCSEHARAKKAGLHHGRDFGPAGQVGRSSTSEYQVRSCFTSSHRRRMLCFQLGQQ